MEWYSWLALSLALWGSTSLLMGLALMRVLASVTSECVKLLLTEPGLS
jgi:hypothetical protein